MLLMNNEFQSLVSEGMELAVVEELACDASKSDKLVERNQVMALPIVKRSVNQVLAVLVWVPVYSLEGTQALLEAAALHFRSIFYHLFELTYVQNLLIQQQISDKEALRRDTLIQVAKRLHDQNDVSSVLNVLLMDLEHLYPHANVDLYLSQDHVNGDPRVKPLLHSTCGNRYICQSFS